MTGSWSTHWQERRYPSRTRSSPSWSASMIVGGGAPVRNLTRHDVQRPRPPHVAVMSTPPAWAALRIVAPAAAVRLRRDAGSLGSTMIVSATAMVFHSSGMLAPMEITVETLQRLARLGGF